MPQLVGLSKEEAVKKLNELGITNIKIFYDYNPAVALDEVVEQEIAGGARFEKVSPFTLRLSGADQKFSMPDCGMMKYDEAVQWFSERGVSFMLAQEYAEYESEGWLISQSPSEGTVVDVNQAPTGSVVYSLGYLDDEEY